MVQSVIERTAVNPNTISPPTVAGDYRDFISDGTAYTGTGGNPVGNNAGALMKMSSTGVLTPQIPPVFTVEDAQDAIGALLVDSNNIDVTYDDTGNIETAVVRQKFMGTLVQTSKTYALSDIGGFYERSNAGVAMTDTLPSLTAADNGFLVEVHNTDATATITFTGTPNTVVIGTAATTYVLQPLCRQTFKWTGTKWLFGAGNANLTKAPTAGTVAAGDLVMVTDATGRQFARATKAMLKLANTADLVADFSADKLGIADTSTALGNANANVVTNGGLIYVPAGRFRVTANTTLTVPLEFNPGGRLVVATGVTVTINARVYAGIDQIFECEGTGKVVLAVKYNVDRYVEWWGGVDGADCSAALALCVVAGSRTWLQSRDYVTSATFAIPAYATVVGAGYNWEATDTATRILCASASVSPIVQLGSTATPVDLNSAPASPELTDVYVTRNQAPNAGTVGILVGWSRFARIERVRTNTSITGFKVTNAISPFLTDTFSKRDIAIAAGQGADSFIGYDIDGTGALPAAGGNASVWLARPQTELNVTIANSTGYYVHGRYTDTFITQPETLGVAYGMDIVGDRGGAGQTVGSNANLVIINPVIDQTKTLGIRIQNVNQWGSVRIVQPYCGPSTGDAITATNCDGTVSIIGGEMRMNVSTTGKGITFDGCRSPRLDATIIAECTTQALVLNNTAGGQFTPMIQNVTNTLSAAVQAVASVTKSQIRHSINGAANKVSIGYQSLASSNDRNSLVTTGFVDGVVATPISLASNAEKNSGFPDLVVQASNAAATANIVNAEVIAGQLVIPANTLQVGTVLRVRAFGQVSATAATASTNTQRLRLGPLGTTADPVLLPIGTLNTAAIVTKIPFSVEFMITCRAIGASGSVVAMVMLVNSGATGIAAVATASAPSGAAPAANNGLLTFNTTVANTLSFTAITTVATTNIVYEQVLLSVDKA